MSVASRPVLFANGAFGAAVQDIILFYSKRFTAPALDFAFGKYAAAMAVYCLAAGLIALIYPYGDNRTAWRAFLVGIVFPTIVAGAIAAADRVGPGGMDVTLRGATVAPSASAGPPPKIEGDILDLMSLF